MNLKRSRDQNTVFRIQFASFGELSVYLLKEEKINSLLTSVAVLKEEHAQGQRDLRKRLEHLEREVASGQEDSTQRVVKRLKEDRTLVFRKKGNKHQFIFNNNVKDQLDAVGKHLEHLEPLSEVQQSLFRK